MEGAPELKRPLVLGLDLGGTKILSAVIDADNKVLSRAKRATPFNDEAKVTAEIFSAAEEALTLAGATAKDIVAIGMGSPGPLDPDTGVVLRTGNINLTNYAIGKILTEKFGVPVTLDNDVHMGCYGEYKVGAGQGAKNIVGLWMGTGVGGCVIWDGKIVQGINKNAGEIGHIILDAKLHLKDCKRGTLESESSKTGITAYIKRKIAKGVKTKLKKAVEKDRLKSGDLGKAYEAGDEVAIAAVEHSALFCGIAVANLFNILSPELYILGGGVTETLGEPYLKLVQKAANKHAYSTELGPINLAVAKLGDDSGVIGAALAAKDKFLK